MASDYSKKVQSDNRHLSNLTTARLTHVDGSVTTPVSLVPAGEGCRLSRVVLNTNGATLIVRTGSRVLASIAADAPEQTFDYGGYCENGLIYEAGGALSATIAWEK